MDSTSVWLGRELAKKIAELETTLTRTITSGNCDQALYRYLCGQMAALEKVSQWIAEADPEEQISRRPRLVEQKVY